jgi:ATP-binding cassette, subfamily B (MDR/TAP), member 1
VRVALTHTKQFHSADSIQISFAYPSRPNHTVLHESTFFFPAGETTFVVGKSGSGKSTLGNLLMRFYPPSTGQVFIDGTEIRDLDSNWLRNNITLVQQSSILFNETIMRNIAFGQQDFRKVTIEEVKVCLEVAALHDTISEMPKGLETMVGARGTALSGGQKQRIAIARARLRDTPILILDESTSALDYISRTSVINATREWRRGKTTVVITHDRSQIKSDDFVYVLDGGYIVEEGYRRCLAESANKGFFSAERQSPQISMAPQFDFRLDPVRILSKSLRVDSYRDTAASRRSSLEQDSIDIHLGSIAQSLDYRPHSVSYAFHNAAGGTIARPPSHANAVASPIKRLSRILGTSLFSQHPAPHQDLGMLRKQSARIGGGASRPMSLHQAIVMRSIYRQPSVRSRSDINSSLPKRRPASQRSIWVESRLAGKKQEQVSIKNIVNTLWPSLNFKNRVLLFLGFVAILLHATGVPAFAYIFSQLLGTFFIKENQAKKALLYSMLILAVAVVDGTACLLSWYLLEAVGEFWVDSLRIEAMTRVLDQPKVWFGAEMNTVSYITSSLDRSADEIRNLVGRFMGIAVTAAVMILTAIIWALITCWKLTLVGLAAAPIMYGVTRSYEAISSRWEGRTNEASNATEAIFVEAFGDILTVRALTLESYFHKKYTSATSSALTIGIRRAIYCGFFFGASDATVHFVTALIFWYGGDVVRSHRFSVKAVLTAFTMLLSSTSNATAAIAFVPQIASSIDSGSRLLRLARLPVRTSHEHGGWIKLNPEDPHTLSGPIKFSNVTFSYSSRPETLVLSNLNLTIPGGRCTAIVGSSGSGKSTIASLLLGLYPSSTHRGPCQSSESPPITLSGHDIRSLHLPTLRSMISIVPQTPTLFPASVRVNITYGLESNNRLTSLANLEQAAQRAGIHDFIASLPGGYETVIGDGGLGLSGGQAQRIVIARALCRRPKILILDEATSALDGESAWVVRRSVMELVGEGSGMTVIIITHSMDMMQCADYIVVLEQGRVAEEGVFRELLARKGRLWEMLGVGGVLGG